MLACTSDKGTAHIFSLVSEELEIEESELEHEEDTIANRISTYTTSEGDVIKNKKSVLSFFSKILPKYYSSEWSFVQYTIGCGKDEITK